MLFQSNSFELKWPLLYKNYPLIIWTLIWLVIPLSVIYEWHFCKYWLIYVCMFAYCGCVLMISFQWNVSMISINTLRWLCISLWEYWEWCSVRYYSFQSSLRWSRVEDFMIDVISQEQIRWSKAYMFFPNFIYTALKQNLDTSQTIWR